MKSRDCIIVTSRKTHFIDRQIPCAIGHGGITHRKIEGDGATPAGLFSLGPLLYRPDRISLTQVAIAAVPLRSSHIWSDDVDDVHYNHLLRDVAHWPFSHERMFRADPVYDLVIPVQYNTDSPQVGLGSAIFLHIWRGPRIPTQGCVAFSRDDFVWIIRHLTERTRLLVKP